MSKPTPKQNFLQTALLMMAIVMGYQLFFGNRQQQQQFTLAQLYSQLQTQNATLHDLDIAHTVVDYDHKLDDMVSKKQMSQADADQKKIEAQILVADTQLKSGLYRNDANKLRAAYQGLVGYQKRLLDKPAWNTSYAVNRAILAGPATEHDGTPIAKSVSNFPWTSWTGQSIYDQVVKDLSERNKTDYVWGVIPGYQLVDFLVHLTGAKPGFSYAFAAFLLALLVRSIVYPLVQKQLMFSRQMSQLVPLTNEIKQRYKNDTTTQQQKVMELYREYGINPLSGCFPALIQLPFFTTIYYCMLRYQFEFQHGTFLWINPATSKATGGFIAPNLGQQDYILILIYGITMVSASMLTPITDPTQAKQQRLMGVGVSVLFTVFMFTGAFQVVSGFVLYWTFTNILATTQSLRSYRLPMPPLVKLNGGGGGVLPRPTSKWQQMMDKMMEEQKRQSNKNGDTPPSSDNSGSNGDGSANITKPKGPVKTGTPAKHKAKKRN